MIGFNFTFSTQIHRRKSCFKLLISKFWNILFNGMATQETFFDMCLCFSLLWSKHCKDLLFVSDWYHKKLLYNANSVILMVMTNNLQAHMDIEMLTIYRQSWSKFYLANILRWSTIHTKYLATSKSIKRNRTKLGNFDI